MCFLVGKNDGVLLHWKMNIFHNLQVCIVCNVTRMTTCACRTVCTSYRCIPICTYRNTLCVSITFHAPWKFAEKVIVSIAKMWRQKKRKIAEKAPFVIHPPSWQPQNLNLNFFDSVFSHNVHFSCVKITEWSTLPILTSLSLAPRTGDSGIDWCRGWVSHWCCVPTINKLGFSNKHHPHLTTMTHTTCNFC